MYFYWVGFLVHLILGWMVLIILAKSLWKYLQPKLAAFRAKNQVKHLVVARPKV